MTPTNKRRISVAVTFTVFPFCDHEEFSPTCIWCADASRVAKEKVDLIANFQNETASQHTQIHIETILKDEGE